jgi:hypothetical protein
MVPGYNSGVHHAGVEFHVQTEDLGARAASVLTLVYKGGAILARQKTNYRELLGENPSPDEIKRLMETQHKAFMQRVASGEFAEPAPAAPPAGDEVRRLIAEYVRRRAQRKPQA